MVLRGLAEKQPVIITGFWRSGTTILQEILTNLLKGKPVFEPLHPNVNRYKKAIAEHYALAKDFEFFSPDFKAFMPYLEKDESINGAMGKFLKATMRGERNDKWVKRIKNKGSLFSNKNVIVKLVRGHLLIPWLQNHSGALIIHIRRDPHDCIKSFVRYNWGQWIRGFSLENLLLTVNDGRGSFFEQWREEIQRYDQQTLPEKLVLYRLLVEYFVDVNHDPRIGNIKFLNYEDFLSFTFTDFQNFVGDQLMLEKGNFDTVKYKPSATTVTSDRNKQTLEEDLISKDTILKIYRDLGFDYKVVE